MSGGVRQADEGRGDPGDFGREVRRLALDARRILGRHDSPIDEVFRLHARVWRLLRDVPGARPIGVFGWLLAVRQRIGSRLQRWSLEELESLAG